ncbi:type II toxin-antitoxin system RelE/ParE family toxin [Candidatus Woesearchaeota archaeon]|nr:type II toxin-antitoxin system RelE/ParE family toxin [Candidatus Woesearchaeota archaeon]
MFDVEYSKKALKFLKSCDKTLADRIIDKVKSLKKEPIGHDSKSVEGYKIKLYRIRAGDYRILYEVDYSQNVVGIVKIDKRSKAYE